MTNRATIVDQICQFFGGAYDSTTHSYHTPTVTGLSVVRRAFQKRDDFADYFYGQPAGTATGCQMVVFLPDTKDRRVALPAVTGRRKTNFAVELHCFVWSKALYAEDTQDFVNALCDGIVAKIRTDPALGTGGIENGAFQVGEGQEDGGGEIATHMAQPYTDTEGTKTYLLVSFEAHSFDVA